MDPAFDFFAFAYDTFDDNYKDDYAKLCLPVEAQLRLYATTVVLSVQISFPFSPLDGARGLILANMIQHMEQMKKISIPDQTTIQIKLVKQVPAGVMEIK